MCRWCCHYKFEEQVNLVLATLEAILAAQGLKPPASDARTS